MQGLSPKGAGQTITPCTYNILEARSSRQSGWGLAVAPQFVFHFLVLPLSHVSQPWWEEEVPARTPSEIPTHLRTASTQRALHGPFPHADLPCQCRSYDISYTQLHPNLHPTSSTPSSPIPKACQQSSARAGTPADLAFGCHSFVASVQLGALLTNCVPPDTAGEIITQSNH